MLIGKNLNPKPRISLQRGLWLDVEEFSVALEKVAAQEIKRRDLSLQSNANQNKLRSLGGGLWLDIDDFIGDLEKNIDKYAEATLGDSQKGPRNDHADIASLVKSLQQKIKEYNSKKKDLALEQGIFQGKDIISKQLDLKPIHPSQLAITDNFKGLSVDLDANSTSNAVIFALGQQTCDISTQKVLNVIPTMRRFKAEPSPIFLVLGCALLENLIQYENESIKVEITSSLKLLQSHPLIAYEQQTMFKQIETDYESLIAYIEKGVETNLAQSNPRVKIVLIRKIYEGILAKSVHAATVSAIARAVIIAHVLNNLNSAEKKFCELETLPQISNSPDDHLDKICQLFADKFSFRINLIDIDYTYPGKEVTQRHEFYPTSGNFAFDAAILSIFGKKMKLKGLSYPEGYWSQKPERRKPSSQKKEAEIVIKIGDISECVICTLELPKGNSKVEFVT